MKTLALLLASAVGLLAQTASVNRSTVQFNLTGGNSAPSSGNCDAASEVNRIYVRYGAPATYPQQVYICRQTGTSTYAWEPFAYRAGTTAPAKCTVGDLFFDTDATAGSNIFGCTATDTWTVQASGGSTGDVVGPASATNNCFPLYDGTTGKLLKNSTLCQDTSKNGGVSFTGSTSGELGLTVANVAGTAVTIVLPADTSTATTGYVLALGGTTTCPTALPTGFPSTCRSSSWAASGGGTTVSAASPYITISGTNYLPFGMYTVTTPPASSWTALNSQTSSTGSQGEITMTTVGTSNSNFYGFYRTITSNTLEAAIMCTSGSGGSTVRAGVGVRGSGGDMVIVGPNVNSNVSPGFGIAKWTNATTYSGGYETGLTGSGVYYIKVVNNGSTITPYGSFDGKFWVQIYDGGGSVNNVTGTGWAWGTQGSGNSVLNGYCELLSWKEY